MSRTLRVTVVVVLLGVAAALPGVQALALAPSGTAHGCHSHSSAPLSPVSYQCCANGHNWAMVASPLVMAAPVVVGSQAEFDLLSFTPPEFTVFAFLSSSPPGGLPLRI